jgi:hypothetical protein
LGPKKPRGELRTLLVVIGWMSTVVAFVLFSLQLDLLLLAIPMVVVAALISLRSRVAQFFRSILTYNEVVADLAHVRSQLRTRDLELEALAHQADELLDTTRFGASEIPTATSELRRCRRTLRGLPRGLRKTPGDRGATDAAHTTDADCPFWSVRAPPGTFAGGEC